MAGPSDFFCNPRQLPSGDGFDFVAKLRYHSELLHKAQGIPVHKAFHDFAVGDTAHRYARDGDLLSCWRNPRWSTNATERFCRYFVTG